MSDFEFARAAQWPWLLALPVVWALLWLALDGSHRAMSRYGAGPLTPVSAPLWRSLRLTALLGLGMVCWLDPRWGEESVDVERRGLDLIFCLDTSQSMLARDMQPTRLDRAKRDIRSVLPMVEGGDRVGLVVFAGEARLWIPLTHDVASFEGLLDEVDTDIARVGGTDLAKALRRSLELADPDDVATGGGGDVHDGAAVGDAWQKRLGEMPEPEPIHPHDLFGGEAAAVGDAGTVEEHIDDVRQAVDDVLDGRHVAQIAGV